MTQNEAWEALSAVFETAKNDYFEAKSNPKNAQINYLEGRFQGLYAAREILAPFFLETYRNRNR
jgi:hypothetical protein